MPRSYQRINYSLRPAKSVERKMMCEAWRRLGRIHPLHSYRYVGFGSPFFTDFQLVHRFLGIDRMISIERHVEDRDRFEFNKPFSCVDVRFGESNDLLPAIDWGDGPSIVWLDYDGGLDASAVSDVLCVCSRSAPGSFVAVSVNAHTPPSAAATELDKLRADLGDMVPPHVQTADISEAWSWADLLHSIIDRQVKRCIKQRNAAVAPNEMVTLKQLFRFHYADGARMLTWGGLLHRKTDAAAVKCCGFDELEFCRAENHPFHIQVPSLTFREIQHLEAQMPCDGVGGIDNKAIPEAQIERYAAIYRYFPRFAETDV